MEQLDGDGPMGLRNSRGEKVQCFFFEQGISIDHAIGIHAFASLEALACVWPIKCLWRVHFLTG
jgi:hypothetical protein